MTIAALALAASAARAAPPPDAEEALARQQTSLHSSLGLDCERRRAAGEIIVCARTGPDPDRIPLYEPDPDVHHAGEPPDGTEALALSKEQCTTVGPNQQCGGGLPLIPIAIWLAQTAVKIAKDKD